MILLSLLIRGSERAVSLPGVLVKEEVRFGDGSSRSLTAPKKENPTIQH